MKRRAFLRLSLQVPPMLLFTSACGAHSGMRVELAHGNEASLGGTIDFTLTAICVVTTNNEDERLITTDSYVYFGMTDGVVPVESQEFTSYINERGVEIYRLPVVFIENQKQTYTYTVRIERLGDHQVAGGALAIVNNHRAGDSRSFFLRVSEHGTTIQSTPFS